MTGARICSCTGCTACGQRCGRITSGSSRCSSCRSVARKRSDARRPKVAARGYSGTHVTRFRAGVLARDPTCVIDQCTRASKHADHFPLSRRELVDRGLDPNDPAHGRGLCARHHSSETARHQPGGFRVT